MFGIFSQPANPILNLMDRVGYLGAKLTLPCKYLMSVMLRFNQRDLLTHSVGAHDEVNAMLFAKPDFGFQKPPLSGQCVRRINEKTVEVAFLSFLIVQTVGQ